MRKPSSSGGVKLKSEASERLVDFIEMLSGKLLPLAGGVAVVAFGLLIALANSFTTGGNPDEAARLQTALGNVGLLQNGLVLSLLVFGVTSAVVWWREPQLPVIQVIVALVVVLAPMYLPMIPGFDDPEHHPAMLAVFKAFQDSGTVFSVIAAIVLVIDIAIRVRERMSYGMRADQLRFGKGIKEEASSQNRFMGKCWQLPYCRKFVRERCPIYHAKRSCWKEKVGCMCEEAVIRNAMENRAIPKDALAAAKYIPQNKTLTLTQKIGRCRQCVIYNEHQKHKYRLWLFVINVSFLGFSVMFWAPMNDVMNMLVKDTESIYKHMTFKDIGLEQMVTKSTIPFTGILLAAILLVIFTNLLKMLEWMIFKLKI